MSALSVVTLVHIILLEYMIKGVVSSNIDILPDIIHERDGDLRLGVLGRVSQWDPVKLCSENPTVYALYEMGPAAVYAIDDINSRDDILQNITLGFIIVDTCSNNLISAARSLQFAPILTGLSNPMSFGNHYDVKGVIGPVSSQASVFTGTLFSTFRVPAIATASTSDELSDNDRFPYLFRLVPADYHQVEAMVLFFKSMGWNHFSVVHYNDNYGYSGLRNLNYWATIHGLCIATSVGFTYQSDPITAVQTLYNAAAKLVVVVNYGKEIQMLADGVEQLQLEGHFIFAFTDCFVDQTLVGLGHVFINSLWLHPYDVPDQSLSDYLKYLSPEDLPDDPWLADIRQCFLPAEEANVTCGAHFPLFAYSTYSVSYRVVDAVYVYAAVIDKIVDDHCPEGRVNKSLLNECVTSSRVAEYLHEITVDRPSGPIEFTENRDQMRILEWSQFQLNPPLPFLKAVPFGKWNIKNNSLTIEEGVLVWDGVMLTEEEKQMAIPESVCSYPCGVGEIYLRGDLKCCWECYRCWDNQIAAENLTRCIDCPWMTWPDEETGYTSCREIPPTYLTWTHPYGITLTTLSVVGILTTCVIILIVVKHRERRVIRGSGRDMIAIILAGCVLGYAGTLTFIADPGKVVCAFSRVCFNLSMATIFSPLLIKMHRIRTIFGESNKFSQEMKCVGFCQLQMLTWTCVALQIAVTSVTSVIWEPRTELRMPVATEEYVEMACYNTEASMLIPLVYNLILLLSCGVLGFLTRKVPECYNEAYYIFITVVVTFIIWIAFFSTYFSAFYIFYQAALQAFALFLNVTVVIVIIFGPKLFALYNIPDNEIQITHFKNKD